MNPPPRNPLAFADRAITALCDDILDPQGRQSLPRLNALREIRKETNRGL